MTMQDDLRRAGVDPASINRAPDVGMAENAERLRRGEVDVIQVFEPYVDQAVAGGWGHVWHRFAWRGDMSYTSFYTTRQFAAAERETRSEEHTSELQSLMRISYAVFCLKKKTRT